MASGGLYYLIYITTHSPFFVHQTQHLEYWSHDSNYMFKNYISFLNVFALWGFSLHHSILELSTCRVWTVSPLDVGVDHLIINLGLTKTHNKWWSLKKSYRVWDACDQKVSIYYLDRRYLTQKEKNQDKFDQFQTKIFGKKIQIR